VIFVKIRINHDVGIRSSSHFLYVTVSIKMTKARPETFKRLPVVVLLSLGVSGLFLEACNKGKVNGLYEDADFYKWIFPQTWRFS